MKTNIKLNLGTLCILFLFAYFTNAQEARIEITQLETINNKLVITYDFSDDVQNQLYDVWVEITNLSGRRINARTLSGDIGDNLVAGKNKKITWDFVADDIVIDAEINIEVKALASRPGKTLAKKTTKGKAILLSTIFPGWGLSKANPGKPYWLMGASAYLLAGGSILLNQMADKEYTSYTTELDPQLSEDSFNKSKSYNNLSKATGYTALGIWSLNLIWTAIQVKNDRKISISELNKQRLHFYSSYNQKYGTVGFTINYTF
ncbi:MAG: hypothetical protein P1P88_25560 [Bacteroidales bacterium]|nr:hypothetical protein [Bacteroidales bacterium]